MPSPFRELVPGPDFPRTIGVGELDAYSHAERSMGAPKLAAFVDLWRKLEKEPFVGVTCDGRCEKGLYRQAAEGAPTAAAAAAARHLLSLGSGEERSKLCHPIDAPEWRRWSNPEFYVNRHGLRLEEIARPLREAIFGVLKASLSPRGFEKARDCMRMNHFLGEIIGAPGIMNENSYNFGLFGEPTESAPWGWQFFGHHLALNCLFIGDQMVISPTFMGAEPNNIDVGPRAGLTMFQDEEQIGLDLMQSLAEPARHQAQIYRTLLDPAMPVGRWHHADQRQLGGAFRDNRIIPYEGVRADALDAKQRSRLLQLVGAYLEYLPPGPFAARMAAIDEKLDTTYFSWIGGYGERDAFYYRIQSPLVMIEFDHHSGVWLTNSEPAKCHIHTIVRAPNGNDYGRDLLAEHFETAHPGERPARG
jgi:hypothetical protein